MAQWQGQFSGRTHESRVREVELALTQALQALRIATADLRARQAKHVRALASKLLRARIRQAKARGASQLKEVYGGTPDARKRALEATQHRVNDLEIGGIAAIFTEFGVADVDLEVRDLTMRSSGP